MPHQPVVHWYNRNRNLPPCFRMAINLLALLFPWPQGTKYTPAFEVQGQDMLQLRADLRYHFIIGGIGFFQLKK